MGMEISVQKVVNIDPQVLIIAGSNDHLESSGLLNGMVDRSSPNSEVIGRQSLHFSPP